MRKPQKLAHIAAFWGSITGRMIFRKAVEMEIIKKDPTEFAIIKKEKKTIEELEKPEVPRYLGKDELALQSFIQW